MRQTLKIWLDDCRPMPIEYDIWCKDEKSIKEYINTNKNKYSFFISFDHDLGVEADCGSGYSIAKWIEDLYMNNEIDLSGFAIHSANPIGRKRINSVLFNLKERKDRWSNI